MKPVTSKMYLHFTPLLVQWLFPRFTWRRESSAGKTIYLTFDDGPVPEVTPWVLKVLKGFNAKATFFCVGDNVRKYPQILEQILEEGHQVGNHTYNHLNGSKTAMAEYLQNVEWCQRELADRSVTTKLFRPPYGRIRKEQASPLFKQFDIVMWEVLSADYDPYLSPQKCLQKSIRYTRKGSIVVFHDNPKAFRNLSWVLPRYLEHFSAKGFTFESL